MDFLQAKKVEKMWPFPQTTQPRFDSDSPQQTRSFRYLNFRFLSQNLSPQNSVNLPQPLNLPIFLHPLLPSTPTPTSQPQPIPSPSILPPTYNSIMNYQKKLIAIFRSFVQKIFTPQIRKSQGNLQQWTRFNTLLSNDVINYNELQIYVDTLPNYGNTNYIDKKELPLHLRKREELPNYVENFEAFNPSKTFGGEKSKNILIGIRQQEGSDSKREIGKEYTPGKEYQQDSIKKASITSMPNINLPPPSYQNVTVNQSLDRLLRQLVENQQKIQAIEGKGF